MAGDLGGVVLANILTAYRINGGKKTGVPADDPHAKITLHNERDNGALHRASDAYQGGQRQLGRVLLQRERLRRVEQGSHELVLVLHIKMKGF